MARLAMSPRSQIFTALLLPGVVHLAAAFHEAGAGPTVEGDMLCDEGSAMQVSSAFQRHETMLIRDEQHWPDFDVFKDAVASIMGGINTSAIKPAMDTFQTKFNGSLLALMSEVEAIQKVALSAKKNMPVQLARSADKVGTFVNISNATLEAVLEPWRGITEIFKNMSDAAMEAVHEMGQPKLAKVVYAFFEPCIVAAQGVSLSIVSCERQLDEVPHLLVAQGNSMLLAFGNTTKDKQRSMMNSWAQFTAYKESLTEALTNNTAFVAQSFETGIHNLTHTVEGFWPAELFNITPYFVSVDDAVRSVFDVLEASLENILQVLTDPLAESSANRLWRCAFVLLVALLAGFS